MSSPIPITKDRLAKKKENIDSDSSKSSEKVALYAAAIIGGTWAIKPSTGTLSFELNCALVFSVITLILDFLHYKVRYWILSAEYERLWEMFDRAQVSGISAVYHPSKCAKRWAIFAFTSKSITLFMSLAYLIIGYTKLN
jgi:hypothetical protein